jgi:hypothetical protein
VLWRRDKEPLFATEKQSFFKHWLNVLDWGTAKAQAETKP